MSTNYSRKLNHKEAPSASPSWTRLALQRKGSVSIESAIVMPFLVILFIGVFDLGTALNNYLVLTQVIQEAVRAAAQTPELEPSSENQSTMQSMDGTPALPASVTHNSVHQRLYFLLNLQPVTNLTNVILTSGYIPAAGGASMNEHTVTINFQAEYNSIFMKRFKINLTAISPYLF